MHIKSVILHDIRSTHNVGAIMRTCDGLGVKTVYIGGITPYPRISADSRLPHIADKLTKDIAKTALGAESSVKIILYEDLALLIKGFHATDESVVALEQDENSVDLRHLSTDKALHLLLGREVEGVDPQYLKLCDHIAEIPMHGKKESLNVSVACGIALYTLGRDA